jgi:hypothetical protein
VIAAPALPGNSEQFQVHNYLFDLRPLLAQCRQNFVYIHVVSEFLNCMGSISIYTLAALTVKQKNAN